MHALDEFSRNTHNYVCELRFYSFHLVFGAHYSQAKSLIEN